jgi:hypothetical protein
MELLMVNTNLDALMELPNFLNWKNGTYLVEVACNSQLDWTHRRLVDWSNGEGHGFDSLVPTLSQSSQERFLTAPRLHHLLWSEPTDEAIGLIHAFIKVEQLRSTTARDHDGCGWSALGDIYLPNGSEPGPAFLSTGERYLAPKVAQITVDAYSPLLNVRALLGGRSATVHDLSELETITYKLKEALDLIESDNAAARVMINASTRSIVVTKSHPSICNGSSRTCIGAVHLANVHSDVWSIGRLMDALVHEAIHSLIYKLELATPLYVDEAAASGIELISPWTGNSLRLHSFVHATFVWFGLWSFWKNYAGGGAIVPISFLERAQRGFLGPSPLRSFGEEPANWVRPEVLWMMEIVREKVSEGLEFNAAAM